MDQKLDTLEKKALVEIVKLIQKRRMEGTAGGWKDFLTSYDKKFGSSLSDPARRSKDALSSFLKTFTKEDDLKFIAKVVQSHLNRDLVEQLKKTSPDDESPEQGWLVTKLGKGSKTMTSNIMYAVDCEMVLCEDGSEGLVRLCVVDRNLKVKIDELVKPEKAVADYRSEITGLTADDLVGVTCSLAEIQKRMKKLLSNGTILVGHSLNNDLEVLKLDHPRVIDTSLIFKYVDEYRRPSLYNLCKSVLGYEIRKKGTPHNCLDDASAAMKLVLAIIERRVDNDVPLLQEDVAETERARLFLHRIPTKVPSEELHGVIPGDFTIEAKAVKRIRGDNYAAFAIFSSSQEANQAFENVKGNQCKDSYGRPQKLVEFQSNAGIIASLYVRKMVCDEPSNQIVVKKRTFEGEENAGVSKKHNIKWINEEEKIADTNQCKCEDHLKVIERLKRELREKDFQISMQDKNISDLKKKVAEMKDQKSRRR
ncbi:small RNA degrading nuclease 1 isoform X2 [Citrus sinensis]|uniref:small RNA degrading nuclease 1 isoform X2 n=1 Tax=Citrus sinensis TaxID=2711 RepID=UPI00227916ED|nr:small RNA degrading nuclease 1 isoform X2 [Citrus sinensis]